MRIVPFLVNTAVSAGFIIALSTGIGSTPPVGKLLSPSHGFWKNAEPADQSFSAEILAGSLQNEVTVNFDDRLVPHVFAQNDHDAYLVEGYLHAKFRLWQMDFESYAAAGRLCEILGEKLGENSILELRDRHFRRLGMTYAAEQTLEALNENADAKQSLDAYTEGVNLYLASLKPEDYPIEYKLLNYAPEKWTNLKSLLILKYMSYDLTTDFDDFATTDLVKKIGLDKFNELYPLQYDSASPIASMGTIFMASRPLPVKPAGADSIMLSVANSVAAKFEKRNPDIGSNNWVAGPHKTASGHPILCNDPHLSLNLPSLWYEIQMHTPDNNAYGVSLPGLPSVVIGFNDSIAWGLTNASRDVMDFYKIKFRDTTMNEYWYDSAWKQTTWRVDTIHIKGKPDFIDRIPFTVWGPVMYEPHYKSALQDNNAYAVRWTAHNKTCGDLLALKNLSKAKNYTDYVNALKQFNNPGQNFVFASKSDDIALWQAGKYPAKWKNQGDLIMPGDDSSFAWQGYIPFEDLVHEYNPARGFASSANQLPADTSYPYYLGGDYDLYRSFIINRTLANDSNFTVAYMQKMQTSNYDVHAEMALPLMLKYIDGNALSPQAKKLLQTLKNWDYRADANESGKTIFETWYNGLLEAVLGDDLKSKYNDALWPQATQTLLEGLKRDTTSFRYIDDINTTEVETLQGLLASSLNKAAADLGDLQDWGGYRAANLNHLLKLKPFSVFGLKTGGGRKIINATDVSHGPSWRMVVHLNTETEAYGVYPGGQNGNPGSKYYDQFADTWATGKYYRLLVLKEAAATGERTPYTMHFKKS